MVGCKAPETVPGRKIVVAREVLMRRVKEFVRTKIINNYAHLYDKYNDYLKWCDQR